MPSPLPRSAEHRRLYRLHSLLGLAIALVLLLAVFTAPVVAGEPEPGIPYEDEPPTLLDEIPQTDVQAPPPPPPPAPAPPIEIDDATVETAVVDELVLDPAVDVPLPSPPAAPSHAAPMAPPPPPPPPPPAPPTVESDDEILDFLPIEDAPKLIGGLDGLQARVVYPELAIRAEIEGIVHVRFVVDEEGRVVDPEVVRSPSELLSRAALDAVRSARFVPGHQRGRPVQVRFALPVRFVLR